MTQEVENQYNYDTVEEKWQKKWTEAKVYETDPGSNEKYFINFPFPYINGTPHLGHGYSLLKADAMARYQRMLGKNTLFPFGFHATGEPIVGMAKRIKKGDENQKKALLISGISEEDISKFEDPTYIISYFRQKWTETLKSLGMAIDWRRQFVTTQMTPTFSKFVEWHYRKLKREGYVIQGSHPVIWCPADQNPTGDHDRLEGEGARVVDFNVLKFHSKKFNANFLPGTLRPETIFGVTNMFIHPTAEYVKVELNGEAAIISKDTLIKFEDQEFEVGAVEPVDNTEIIGSTTTNPMTGQEVIILPGDFIDSAGATGVVMSVPAHAPMDWIMLQNLKATADEMSDYGIDPAIVRGLEPIALIEVPDYGTFPAGEEIEKRGITDRTDPEVKEATRTIYRKEANYGKLIAITGKYEGMAVEPAKLQVAEDMQAAGTAFILKEPAEPVVCRCGTRNHVKYLENQWFLKFSDEEWKQKTHDLIDRMNVFPEEARKAFHNTVDWLENKACARRSGLGTPMPWDQEWIIETLSDSVIYMAYYIVSKFVNAGEFKEEFATDEVYDYIVVGKGDPAAVAESVGMEKDLLVTIRKELEYFYGFDLRTTGKDLVNNHMTFMLMHHTAIFEEEFLPKGVAVNGYVAIVKPGDLVAQKMSKSKGNFKTIEDVIDSFGVDATRLGFLIAGEGMKDAQFSLAEAESYVRWIQNLYEIAFVDVEDDEEKQIDRWLYSRIQVKIKSAREYLSQMQTRSAFQSAYHELSQDIKWYLRRRGTPGPAYKDAIVAMVGMVAPFIPHVVEEIWEQWGENGFAVNASYPAVDETKIFQKAENAEKFLGSFIDDLRGLRSFLSEKGNPDPKLIEVYISDPWKYEIYNLAFENGVKNLIGSVMKDQKMKEIGKPAVSYTQSLMKGGAPPDFSWSFEEEKATLEEAHAYLEEQVGVPITFIESSESDHPKSKIAIPRRPGVNFVME